MKVRITVTDGQGVMFEGSAELVRLSKSGKAPKTVAKGETWPRNSRRANSLNVASDEKRLGWCI